MAKVDLWVPIIGTGADDDPFTADAPQDISWESHDGVPCELDPASPERGKPIGKYMLITVAAPDAHKVTSAVMPEQVEDETRLLVEACRLIERLPDASLTGRSEGAIKALIIREKARAQKPEGGALLHRLVVHLVRRGLSEATALAASAEAGIT